MPAADPRAIAATSLRLAAAAVGSATLAHPHWMIDAARCLLDGAAEVVAAEPWSTPQRMALVNMVHQTLCEVPRTDPRRAADVGRGLAALPWLVRGWMS